jgi:hypothetical protein
MRVLSKTTKILFALILGLEAWGFWVRIMDGSYLMGGGGLFGQRHADYSDVVR